MKTSIKKTGILLFGVLFYTTGVNLFIVSNGVYSGGFVGIGQVVRTVLINYLHLEIENIDIAGIVFYIINIPLLAIAYFKISKSFFVKTIVIVTVQTLFLTFIPTDIQIIKDDILTSIIIGSILAGYGVGLVLREGASGGGQDILGVYFMQKNNSMSVGKIALIVNAIVFTMTLIMYDITTVLYSLIFVALSSFITDKVHHQNISMKAFIVTEHCDKVKSLIEKYRRTTTIIDAVGGLSQKKFKVIYTVLSKFEAMQLKAKIEEENLAVFAEFSETDIILGNFQKHL